MIAIIITTTGSRNDAEFIANNLLKERLAACVSIAPVTSLYWRKGSISKDDECILIIKTTIEKANKAAELIKRIHPYELPEILIIRAEASKEYEERVRESTK